MQMKLRILFYAITILVGVLATKPCAQSLGRDDDRIWIEFDMQIRPQPGHPTGNTYRGGKLSLRVSGLLEPQEYDTPDTIGFFCSETPWTMSAEPCQEVEPDGRVSSLPICQINHQAKMVVDMKCDLSTGLCELRILSTEIATWPEGGAVDFDYTFGCLYEAERQETSCQPRVSITRDDLGGDFEKSYTWEDIGGGVFVTGCANIPTYRLVLRARPPDETKVTLSGCADITIGATKEITTTAEPEGGTYTWTCEPADIFGISSSGSTASITGKKAGHATIRVEYQPKRGKKEETTMPGSVVELLSVNGGADIPPIGRYDENGAANPGVQIPTVQDPPEGNLLDFPLTDPGIATAQNLGAALMIQPVKEGTTTTQGQTACNNRDEHVITIEVVPCDKATIQKLRDRLKELVSRRDEITNDMRKQAQDPEFQRAKQSVDKNLTKCIEKLLAISASCLGELGGAASGAASSGKELGDLAETLDLLYDATEKGTWDGDWSLWEMYKNYQIGFAKKMTLGIASDVIEYGQAWFDAQDGMEVMKKIVKNLQELHRQGNEIRKQYNEVDRRLTELCKDFGVDKGKPGKPEPPTADKPTPSKPTGNKKPPSTPPADQPPGDNKEQPPTNESTDQTDDDDIDWDPPFPPGNPPSSGGFPIECDCEKWNQPASRGGISLGQVGRGIDVMNFCMERFEKETLKPLEMVNDSTRKLLDEIEIGLALPESQRAKAFQDILPRLGTARDRVKSLGNELISFKSTSEGCSEASKQMGAAIEQSATKGIKE